MHFGKVRRKPLQRGWADHWPYYEEFDQAMSVTYISFWRFRFRCAILLAFFLLELLSLEFSLWASSSAEPDLIQRIASAPMLRVEEICGL